MRLVAAGLLGLTTSAALVPFFRSPVDLPTAQHHLLHAALIASALIAALLLAAPSHKPESAHYGWLLVAILSPVAVMLLMWPSEYAWFEKHPAGHVLEHLSIAGFAFATGYAGQRYAAGIGWLTGLSLLFMAIASAWGFGVAPAATGELAANVPTPAAVTSDVGSNSARAHIVRGAAVFSQSCAVCHGAQGVGGAGPSLKGEKTRKDLQRAQQWIMNPGAPMPKLFPGTLSRADVRDVAAYVETL